MSSTVRHRLTHARAVILALTGLVCAGVALAGCGGGRVVDPSLTTTARPSGFIVASYPADGVELSVPENWTITAEKAPLVAVFSSGQAIISLWRYPAAGHGPVTGSTQLRGALAALEDAARKQDPSVRFEATGISSVGRAGAVIVDALETINHKLRRVRSEHIYADGAELVLEAYAPVAQFSAVDHLVFSPVRKSLTLLHGGRPSGGKPTTSTTVTPVPATPPTVSSPSAGTPGTPGATSTATSTGADAGAGGSAAGGIGLSGPTP